MDVEQSPPIPPMTREMACPDCDLLLAADGRSSTALYCPRCHCVVQRSRSGDLDRALACYLAAAIFFTIANCFPIVKIEAGGNTSQATLIGAARALHAEHMNSIAILVSLTTVIIPAVELFCTTSVLALAETRHPSGTLAYFLRLRQALRPWNMVEILMLGILVAIVKLGSLASVVLGVGLWALGAFMLAHAAASHLFDPKAFWNVIKRPL